MSTSTKDILRHMDEREKLEVEALAAYNAERERLWKESERERRAAWAAYKKDDNRQYPYGAGYVANTRFHSSMNETEAAFRRGLMDLELRAQEWDRAMREHVRREFPY